MAEPARAPAPQDAPAPSATPAPQAGAAIDPAARYLVIKAKGGLGNRMLSAVTGLVYADLSGRIPVIDWRDGVYAAPGVNAYPLLFDTPLALDPAAFDERRDVTPAVWAGRMPLHAGKMVDGQHSGARVYRKSCVDLARLDQPEPVAVFWSYVPKMPRLRRHLARDPRFRGRGYDAIMSEYLTRYFTPNARVRDGAAAALAGLARPVIGAHLRYTDMTGPLDKVKAELARLRRQMPEAPIFLATDSAKAQADIQAAFGNLHVTEKYLPEDGRRLHQPGDHTDADPVREAENAMIDMWALAGCDHLIYSRNSTFSGASALIGAIPRARLVNVDRSNPRIMLKRFLQDYL